MPEVHDFDDTVVAIFDQPSVAEEAIRDLKEAGYEYELLEGEDGMRQLDPAGQTGAKATLKRILTAFGDQFRIAERLGAELAKGAVVLSVDAGSEVADDAARILKEHGGEFVWKLGAWTYAQVED